MRFGVSIVWLCGCGHTAAVATTPAPSGAAPRPQTLAGGGEDVIDEPESDPVEPPHSSPVQLAGPTTQPSPNPNPFTVAHPPPSPPPPPLVIPDSHRPKRSLGELVLRGHAQATLAGSVDTEVTRACVTGQAMLVVEDGAALTLAGDRTTVIAGRGIAPAAGVAHLHVRIDVPSAADVFVLFDDATVPISALVYAPQSAVHIAITGRAGLTLEAGGIMKSAHYYGGFGVPSEFPACP